MPSPVMDLKGLSSSSRFSEETHFSGERQVGFWKSDTMPDQNGGNGGKLFNASPLSNLLVDTLPVKSRDHTDPFPTLEEKTNLRWDMPAAVQMERAVARSLGVMRPVDPEPRSQSSVGIQAASPFLNGDKINLLGSRYENSLFSSSLSDLFSRKMKLTSSGTLYGHSVDTVASHFEEEEPLESLEELEAQTIGNLLPNDDDLLSGVTDGLDFMHPDKGDDVDELDFFSSVGGMDLEDDTVSAGQKMLEYPGGVYNGSVASEHPFGEHPSRTLFVRNINSNVEDSELRALFEQYGDIRTLYTACKHRGFVMISYYDIRAARTAMKVLQNKPLRRRKLDIHYSIPKDNPSEKDANQGTLVVFNLDPSVSNAELRHIFGDYGEIKEIRETPHRSNHKFVEFYDVRAAEAALNALDKSDIAGKQIKVEPSRPGGARRSGQQPSLDLEQDEPGISVQQNGSANNSAVAFSGAIVSSATNEGNILGMRSALRSPVLENAFHHGISSSVPDGLPSLLRVGSASNHPGLIEPSHSQGQLKLDIRSVPGFHPHSLPEYNDGLANAIPCNSPGTMGPSINQRAPERIDNRQFSRIGMKGHSLEANEGVFGSSGNGSSPIPGHPFSWGNSYHPQPPSMMWPNSPSFVNGLCTASPAPRLQGLHGAPSPMLNTVLPINSHHVGSAPTGNPSIWDRQQVFAGESPDACSFHPVSLGNMRLPNNSLHSMEFIPHNIFPPGGNCMDLSLAQKNIAQQSHHQRSMMFPGRGQMMPVVSSFDSPGERVRSRRNEGASNQADNKKQYELDIDRIMRGEDNRTTLMIKNIPNKYTSKMLLAAIDERHKGTYDFIYLPIDFKNKCNVGYAFINMTEPSQIIPFYKAFNGKKWEKFNSEKVASLAYARIQGKAALIAHFQNSSLMNEDKRCRPILFNTEGPNAGDQVPFPMGVNVRTRPGKARTASLEENNQGSHHGLINGDDSTGETSVSSVKDSD